MNNQKNETSDNNKPVCFIPNNLAYPLCVGKRNGINKVFTTCQSCNIYEDMKEEN